MKDDLIKIIKKLQEKKEAQKSIINFYIAESELFSDLKNPELIKNFIKPAPPKEITKLKGQWNCSLPTTHESNLYSYYGVLGNIFEGLINEHLEDIPILFKTRLNYYKERSQCYEEVIKKIGTSSSTELEQVIEKYKWKQKYYQKKYHDYKEFLIKNFSNEIKVLGLFFS